MSKARLALSLTAVFVALIVAVAVVVSAGRSLWLKTLVWTAVIIVSGLVGWTRLYLGVHYSSDVIGGYLLAAAWLATVAFSRRDLRNLTA